MKNELINNFVQIFGDDNNVKTYFAPGRVNLIGEHTDYNGGHVFPCALTFGTYAVARKREDKKLLFYSMNLEDKGVIESSVVDLLYKKEDDWTNYPKGMIWAMQKKGFEIDNGLDVMYYGNIPYGSGLSSSASIEVLTGFLLCDLFHLDISLTELAILAQYSENNFNGVNCGIMDQFAIAMGKKKHAIFLDTADLSFKYAPLELGDAKILIMNTNKRRGLEDSKYNQRRSECETALAMLQKVLPIHALGDLTEEQYEVHKTLIRDGVCQRRAKHAVYENQRTIKAVDALENNDLDLFGQLMIESHVSLRDDYEVTGVELDTLVEAALKKKGVIGARMTGAGFGGCAVAIVKEDEIKKIIDEIGTEYKAKIGYEAEFYVAEAGDGPCIL